MSNQSGFNYDLLVSRLHAGLCAFQSVRAHRRQRAPVPGSAPMTTPEETVAAPPRAASVARIDEPGDLRGADPLEPQAFIAVGNRIVPVFGTLGAGPPGTMAAPAGPASAPASDTPPPSTPRTAPSAPQEETRLAPPPASAPAASASPLKLSPPTPPPRLGLIYGGHAAPAPDPAQAAKSDPAIVAPAAPTKPTPANEAQEAMTLAALLDARAQQEAMRLEKVHAEHRTALAALLHEHREELRARSEADAARTMHLLREVLGEHRTELARSAQAHAEQLAQGLAQQQSMAQREVTTQSDLRSAMIEQASLQREANADVADHIAALTTIVGDLGQTVGMLAVAAVHADKQHHLPTRPFFAPPPRIEPAVVPPSPVPGSATVVPGATSGVEPVAVAPASSPRIASAAAANSSVPAATAALPASPDAGPIGTSPRRSLSNTITVEPPQRRPIALNLAREAAAGLQGRQAVDVDQHNDDLETGIAGGDHEPPRRQTLGPIVATASLNINERDRAEMWALPGQQRQARA